MLFLNRLMSGYPEESRLTWEVRCIRSCTKTVTQSWYGSCADNLIASDADVAAELWDVYIGVLPRLGRSGWAQDVPFGKWLFADIDCPCGNIDEAHALVMSSPLPQPSMMVYSGGGLHCYWPLKVAFDMRENSGRSYYTSLLKRLVHTIGGDRAVAYADPAATDVSRVLRIPNTLNHKYNPARLVTVAHAYPDPLPIETWDRMLRPLPVKICRPVVPADNQHVANLTVRGVIERASASRNGTQFRDLFTGSMSSYGNDDSRADMALMGILRYWCNGDESLMLDVFAASARGNRDKWREREDYRRRTLDRIMGRA